MSGTSENTELTLSKNVIESYIFATAKHELNITSERLLLQLVKAAQCQIYGLDFRNGGISRVDVGPLGTTVEIEIKDLLGKEGSTNYTAAKEAVKELMKKKHEHEEPLYQRGKQVFDKDGKPVYRYEAHAIVNDVYINGEDVRPGTIKVIINPTTWAAILDFSKGYRRYDLLVAMRLKGVYALRMYKLISNQKYPITYTIKELKEMWGVENKYKDDKDFIKNIRNAKRELDENSPWTFEFESIKSETAEVNIGRRGRLAVTSLRFFPVKQLRYETSSDAASQVSPSMMLGKEVTDILIKVYCFSMKSIQSNMLLFNTCKKYFGTRNNDNILEDFLEQIKPKALRANNINGYVINALKIHLKEVYGLVFKEGRVVRENAK